jgi:large subunit ribosomal protein L15
MIKLHDLKPAEGANRSKRRVGRGIAGKGGKTAGRGTKGQHARNSVRPGFEGGQLPLAIRIPKLKGFTNPFRVSYVAVNVDTLDAVGESTIDPAVLRSKGLIAKKGLVKVLGRGTVSSKLTVKAHAFSKSAEEAIKAAGGSIEILPKPFNGVRPPVKGNQHANR